MIALAPTVADPRPSRHGGHTPLPFSPPPALATRFDWYEATADGIDDGRVADALALLLKGSLTRGKGRNGYAECWNVERGDDVLARVYGRSARLGEVHVVTTSEACDEVVPVLRSMWPAHRVSRADSAIDFAADFSQLDRLAVAFAKANRLRYSLFSDSDGGSTRRIGSPASEVFVRVYKKTEELRARHPERAREIPEGIVRVELVARPGKSDVKEAAATMTAAALWGLGQWTQAFSSEFLQIDAERVSTHFRRPTDWARGLHWLGEQYAPMVRRRAAEVGLERARGEVLAALGLLE